MYKTAKPTDNRHTLAEVTMLIIISHVKIKVTEQIRTQLSLKVQKCNVCKIWMHIESIQIVSELIIKTLLFTHSLDAVHQSSAAVALLFCVIHQTQAHSELLLPVFFWVPIILCTVPPNAKKVPL